MNYKENDTALLILSTGENVMGKVAKVNNQLGIVELEQTVYVVPTEPNPQNPDGGLTTMAYLMFSEETAVDFESKDVRHYLTPKADIADWYKKQFSRIETPPEKKIIV